MLTAIRQLRRAMYPAARLLGDVQAVMSGRILRRIGWRVSGKVAGRVLGRLWR